MSILVEEIVHNSNSRSPHSYNEHDEEEAMINFDNRIQLEETIVLSSPTVLKFGAAMAAAATSCATFNPLDCLRVRWQMVQPSSLAQEQASGLLSYGSYIVRSEGLMNGLWRPGLSANVMGMALSAGIRFSNYETVRDALLSMSSSAENGESDYGRIRNKSGLHMFAAGLICGGVAYGVTTPFHLLKTMIQAEKGVVGSDGLYLSGSRIGKQPYVTNFRSGVLTITNNSEAGVLSLWRGWQPLMARGALFTAGQMLGYDGMKTLARENELVHDGPYLHVISSVCASFSASLFSAPADIIMAKYMASKDQSTIFQCMREIYSNGNGIHGFWRGWSISFFRLTPVMLLYSTLFEQIRYQCGVGYMT